MRSEEEVQKLKRWFWTQIEDVAQATTPDKSPMLGALCGAHDALAWVLGEHRPLFADMIAGLKSVDYLKEHGNPQ